MVELDCGSKSISTLLLFYLLSFILFKIFIKINIVLVVKFWLWLSLSLSLYTFFIEIYSKKTQVITKKVRNWLLGPVCGSKFYLCKLYGPPVTRVRRSAARRRNCLQIGNHFIAPQQGTNFQGALQLEHPILLK